MPQGPGTYGTQQGRPKKKDKVDPKKKQQTSNVAPPSATQQQPPAPQQQQTSNVAPPPARPQQAPQQQAPAAEQKQGYRPNPTDQMGRPVIEDKAVRDQAVESEVAKRMTPEGQDQQRQQLEQEGFLERGSADRMRRGQKEFETEQKPPTDKTPFLDAVENPSSAPGAENWGGVDTVGMMEAERQAEMR